MHFSVPSPASSVYECGQRECRVCLRGEYFSSDLHLHELHLVLPFQVLPFFERFTAVFPDPVIVRIFFVGIQLPAPVFLDEGFRGFVVLLLHQDEGFLNPLYRILADL